MNYSYHDYNDRLRITWDSDWKSIEDIISNAKSMQEMKELDNEAINNRGIPSLWLMENAARSVVEVTENFLGSVECLVNLDYLDNADCIDDVDCIDNEGCSGYKNSSIRKTVVIVCGAGNNGGDGVACAYMLLEKGYTVKAYLCGREDKMTADERAMEVRLSERGGVLIRMFDANGLISDRLAELNDDISNSACCIDALFGVGISRIIASPYDLVIEAINKASYVISCDIPSGLNGDTGVIMGSAVKADITVTFSCIKKGILADTALDCCGMVRVVNIGIEW